MTSELSPKDAEQVARYRKIVDTMLGEEDPEAAERLQSESDEDILRSLSRVAEIANMLGINKKG